VLASVKPGYCWLLQQNTSIQESWRNCQLSVLIGYETRRRQDPQCRSQSQRWTAVSSFIVNDPAKHLWHIRHINICSSVAALPLSDINLNPHLLVSSLTGQRRLKLAQGQLAQDHHQVNCSTIT